jgi:hypothetical protein
MSKLPADDLQRRQEMSVLFRNLRWSSCCQGADLQKRVNTACNQAKMLRYTAGAMWTFFLLALIPFLHATRMGIKRNVLYSSRLVDLLEGEVRQASN